MVGAVVRSSDTPSAARHYAVRAVPVGDGAEPQLGLADFLDDGGDRRLILGHLHVAQQRLDLGGLTGETDTELLAHHAAATVASDEIARAQVRAVRQLTVTPDPDPAPSPD